MANRYRSQVAATVGVTVVENAFRVHLLLSRSASEDALPVISIRGFLFGCDAGEGRANMSEIPSPGELSKTNVDH